MSKRTNATNARPATRKASPAPTTNAAPALPVADDVAPAPRPSLALVPSSPVDLSPAAPEADQQFELRQPDRHGVGFVDLEGKARAENHADIMRFLGHPVEATVYPIGYTVDETGVRNAKAKRAEVDAMPYAVVALDQLSELVVKEDRRDILGRTRDLRALPDGRLQTTAEFKEIVTDEEGKPATKIYPAGFILKPEELSLIDLATDIKNALPAGSPMPAALSQTLISSPPMLRAQIVNFWQEFKPEDHGITPLVKAAPGAKIDWNHVRATGGSEWREELKDQLVPVVNTEKTRKLRTRLQNGERTLYATVGEDFPPIDVDMVAAIAKFACSQIPGDLRARCDYDGRNVRITIISHSTVDPRLYVAGEVFRASAFLGTDDTGGGAIWGYGALDRNLCRNLIILQSSKAGAFRIEHRGVNMRELIEKLVLGVKNAFSSVAVFADLWSNACEEALYLPQGVTSAPKVIREAAEVFALNAAALVTKRDRSGKHMLTMRGSSDASRVQNLVPSMLKMWKKELGEPSSAILNHNGLTRAAMVNALTRYAHEIESDSFRGSELEREAGDLLTARPWTLPTVDQWNQWETTPEAIVMAAGV
jgi:hypothetical protein